MQIFIISLTNASERRSFQELQFSKLNLHFEFFDAITIGNIKNQDKEISLNNWERPLMPSEIACFFSHFNLWKKISASNSPALILEDDAIISKELPNFIERISTLKNIDHISIESRLRKKLIGSGISLDLNIKIAPLFQDRTGAAAYFLWPNGAKMLVNKCYKYGAAIADGLISCDYRLSSWQSIPALAVQSDVALEYDITSPLITHSYIQNGDSKLNHKAIGADIIRFKKKRLLGQLKLAFRFASKIGRAKRILIPVNSKNFVYLNDH